MALGHRFELETQPSGAVDLVEFRGIARAEWEFCDEGICEVSREGFSVLRVVHHAACEWVRGRAGEIWRL